MNRQRLRAHAISCFVSVLICLSGCMCSIEIENRPPELPEPTARIPSVPDEKPEVRTPVKPPELKPIEYEVRGVALLTFYPSALPKVDQGTLGGYIMMYSKTQKTQIPFSGMRDDTCKYSVVERRKRPDTIDFRGLDVGTFVKVLHQDFAWTLQRSPLREGEDQLGVFYTLPTVQDLKMGYGKPFSFEVPGGKDLGSFRVDAIGPKRLEVLEPKLSNAGTKIVREAGLKLRWTFPDAPYFSVRINQNVESVGKDQSRSVTCRFANDGEATIASKYLKDFAVDATGADTQIFFFAGSYTLGKVPGVDKPMISVLEAISTTPVLFE